MGNSWFQFKQFLIRQNHSAMKVTTDACLFGAWVADRMQGKQIGSCLDIGTGTGLLALMIAQKCASTVDAVEIDGSAFREAAMNVAESAFQQQVSVQHADILQFAGTGIYDLIISNPPFFDRSLRSPTAEVNLARHEDSLPMQELVNIAGSKLRANGYFAVLLPSDRLESISEIAASSGLYRTFICRVRQTEKHGFFRVMMILSKNYEVAEAEEEIIIRENGQYSAQFIRLLQDYYLHL